MSKEKLVLQFNTIGFVLIYGIAFVLIAYKVFNVPITHDEVATTVHYSKFSYWEIMMYPDSSPNNHILNTLFTKTFIYMLGSDQWVVRLPNLLSFILYALGSFKVIQLIFGQKSYFFLAASLLFISNPYLMDFFGLSRGYGMASSFCLFSLSYLISGFKYSNVKHVWIAVATAMFACYSSFTLLFFLGATILLSIIYFFIYERALFFKKSIKLVLFSIAFLLLIAFPLYKMQSTNQFVYWEANGFYEDTLKVFVILSLYGSDNSWFQEFDRITFSIVFTIFINVIYIIYLFIRPKSFKENNSVIILVGTSMLLLTVLFNVLQCYLLGTPNLIGRTALFFYPIYIVTLLALIAVLLNTRMRFLEIPLALLVVLICVFHVGKVTRLESVKEWWYDANTFQVLKHLEEGRNGDRVSLHTSWLFNPSFTFYDHTEKTPWLDLMQYNKEIDSLTIADYYYIRIEDFPKLEASFDPVLKFEKEGNWLLKRKKEE